MDIGQELVEFVKRFQHRLGVGDGHLLPAACVGFFRADADLLAFEGFVIDESLEVQLQHVALLLTKLCDSAAMPIGFRSRDICRLGGSGLHEVAQRPPLGVCESHTDVAPGNGLLDSVNSDVALGGAGLASLMAEAPEVLIDPAVLDAAEVRHAGAISRS